MRYIESRIVYVDTSRNCCDAISIDGFNHFENISYVKTGLKAGGSIEHPQIGDVIVVELAEDGQASLYKYYQSRQKDANGLTSFVSGAGKFNRKLPLPGDRTLEGPDGALLSLLRGRLASIGSSPMCQTIYLGLENLIRTVAQNFDVMGSGLRIFSINNDGNVTTRLCFSGSDKNFVSAASSNEDATSENFEYQIDFNKDGVTFFIGECEDSKPRKNNLTIHFDQNGDIKILHGERIQIQLFSNGCYSHTISDDNNNVIYERSVLCNGTQVVSNEYVKGVHMLTVDGNMIEKVTGDKISNCDTQIVSANVIDHTSMVNRKSSGINVSELRSR